MNRFFAAHPLRRAFVSVAFILLIGSPLFGQTAKGWTTLATVQWEVDNYEELVINDDGSWSVSDQGGQQPYGVIVNGSPQTSGSHWAGFNQQAPFPIPGTVASVADWNVQVTDGQAPRCPNVGEGSDPNSTVSVVSYTSSSITIRARDDGGCMSQGRVTFTLQISYQQAPSTTGYVNPKYVIMGVTYAPPGPSGSTFVQYQNSNIVGNTQSVSHSFANDNTVTVSLGYDIGIEDVFAGTITASFSSEATVTTKSTSTITTSFEVQQGEKTFGTGSYFAPVAHDYDVLWVWLNPAVIFSVYDNGTVVWDGYGYDSTDQPEMDIVGIQLGYLNGDFGPLPPQFQSSINRRWAAGQIWPSGQGPALTSADLIQIAAADPFSDSTYGPNFVGLVPPSPETSDHRFTLSSCTDSASIPYSQAAPSGAAAIYTCSLIYKDTTMQAQDIKNEYSVTFSVDAKVKGAGDFFPKLTAELKDSDKLTWTTEYQSSLDNTKTSTSQLSVQGPPCGNSVSGQGPCNPVYDSTGNEPTQFDVYQDNLYGTFMFAPVHYTWPSPPHCTDLSAATQSGTAVPVALSCNDPNNLPLSYADVTQPSHGTLTGTGQQMTYTAAAGYNGPDSFTYKANNGASDSNVATVSISVTVPLARFLTLDDPSATGNSTVNSFGTLPRSIFGDTVVGVYYESNNDNHGFLYNTSTNGFSSFDDPAAPAIPGYGTVLSGIFDNYMVGLSVDPSNISHSFLYNLSTQSFTPIDYPSPTNAVGAGRFRNHGGTVAILREVEG